MVAWHVRSCLNGSPLLRFLPILQAEAVIWMPLRTTLRKKAITVRFSVST